MRHTHTCSILYVHTYSCLFGMNCCCILGVVQGIARSERPMTRACRDACHIHPQQPIIVDVCGTKNQSVFVFPHYLVTHCLIIHYHVIHYRVIHTTLSYLACLGSQSVQPLQQGIQQRQLLLRKHAGRKGPLRPAASRNQGGVLHPNLHVQGNMKNRNAR